MDDSIKTIVVDIGSHTIKVGFGGNDSPTNMFPPVLGRLKKTALKQKRKKGERLYIGGEAIKKKSILSLHFPFQSGLVRNWEDLEHIWRHTFYSVLKVKPEESFVLLTEPVLNTKAHRERLTATMFSKFGVAGLSFGLYAKYGYYEPGRSTALVVDIGDTFCQAVPVYESYVLPHAIMTSNISGRKLTEYLQVLLKKEGYSFSLTDLKTIEEIKEKLCSVSLDAEILIEKTDFNKKCLTLSHGAKVELGKERFLVPEVLFRPSLIGEEALGTHEIVFKSITKCAIDIRQNFAESIVICGGSTLFENFPERLKSELEFLSADTLKLRIIALGDRKFTTWIGASMVSTMSRYNSFWFTRKDFEESGSKSVHSKIYG